MWTRVSYLSDTSRWNACYIMSLTLLYVYIKVLPSLCNLQLGLTGPSPRYAPTFNVNTGVHVTLVFRNTNTPILMVATYKTLYIFYPILLQIGKECRLLVFLCP